MLSRWSLNTPVPKGSQVYSPVPAVKIKALRGALLRSLDRCGRASLSFVAFIGGALKRNCQTSAHVGRFKSFCASASNVFAISAGCITKST